MAGAVKKLYRGQPATTSPAPAVYTTPAGQKTIVREIVVNNPSGSVATVEMFLVPSGGTAAAGNDLLLGSSAQFPPGVTTVVVSQVLEAAESLRVRQGTAAQATVHVSGVENAP